MIDLVSQPWLLPGWLAGWLLVIVKIYFALASVEIVTCPSTSHRMNDRLNLNPTKQQQKKQIRNTCQLNPVRHESESRIQSSKWKEKIPT